MIQHIYIKVNNRYIIIIILTTTTKSTTKNKPKHTQMEMEIVTQGASSFPPVELMEPRIATAFPLCTATEILCRK